MEDEQLSPAQRQERERLAKVRSGEDEDDEDEAFAEYMSATPKHRGPHAVASVFLVVAWLVLVLGIIASIVLAHNAHHGGHTVGYSFAVAAIGVLSTLFSASVLAFFGYVLDLLVEVAESTGTLVSNV